MIELLEAIVGAILLTIGMLALLFSRLQRHEAPRDRTALWFGLFVFLYGLRLTVRSDLVRDVSGHGPEWIAVAAVLTYLTPLPAGLFTESMLGRGARNMLRRAWQALLAYAVLGCAIDLLTGKPGTGLFLNAPFVLFAASVMIVHVAQNWQRHGLPAYARPAVAGAAMFLLIALINTLELNPGLRWADLLEGVGVLALVSGLGYVVAVRAIETERRLTGLSRELELARQIQQSILPRTLPPAHRLQIGARYIPAGDVAGDFYDYAPFGNDRFALIVADVSGHGVPAALVASMVKIAFASAAAEHGADPAAILGSINRALCGKFERAYVTAACAFLDGPAATVTYSNAGHPPPLLRRASGQLEALDAGGMMLAFEPAAQYAAASRRLDPGDAILFFTDGLSEALNAAGEFFGDAALAHVLADGAGADPDAIVERVERELRAWIGSAAIQDDVTVVSVGYRRES